MTAIKVGLLLAALVTANVPLAFAQTTSPKESKVLADGAGAKFKRVDNLHQVRFIEIFLADREAKPAPQPQPSNQPSQQAGGNNGTDTDLRARYALAMLQTAQSNWNRVLAPEATRCEVRFTQIPGGEVIDVAFQRCPFDAQGRESVERALRRAPMPYDEFKSVFERQVTLTFCYPEEACR